MRVPLQHLTSVDGECVVDLPTDHDGRDVTNAPNATDVPAAGPVVLADGLTADDTVAVARTASTRNGLFEERFLGAAVGVRPRIVDTVDETRARVLAELDEPISDGRLRLDLPDPAASVRALAGALHGWFGDLAGRTVAVDRFDAHTAPLIAELVARGAVLVGVATVHGAIADGRGLDIGRLEALRGEHGDLFVTQVAGLELHRAGELHGLAVDALVFAGDPGSIDAGVASAAQSAVAVPIVPAAITDSGIDALRRRQVVPLPDAVSTAGPFLAAVAPRGLSDDEVLARVERLTGERIEAARLAKVDPVRYATTLAETFRTAWLPAATR